LRWNKEFLLVLLERRFDFISIYPRAFLKYCGDVIVVTILIAHSIHLRQACCFD
jgi:hypothetical protein